MLKIQYLGQNGFKISIGDVNMYFDLYLSNSVQEITGKGVRNYAPPIEAKDITDANYYFISHGHLDHMDVQTIKRVSEASLQSIFVCPSIYVHVIEDLEIPQNRIIAAEAYKEIILNSEIGNISVTPIPEKHEEYDIVDGKHGTLGYAVKNAALKFYFVGDAIADEKLAKDIKRQGKMDVMFVPINGRDWLRNSNDIKGNMNYREALDLCHYVGADLVIPMHFDLFNDNTENPAYFVDYLYKNYMGQKFKMFMPGEIMILDL